MAVTYLKFLAGAGAVAALALPPVLVAAPSSAAEAGRPVLTSATATPARLPAKGGKVTVSVALRGAATCRLVLVGPKGEKASWAKKPEPCTKSYRASVALGANPTKDRIKTVWRVVATNSHGLTARDLSVVVAAPTAANAAAAPAVTKAPTGTTVPRRAASSSATTAVTQWTRPAAVSSAGSGAAGAAATATSSPGAQTVTTPAVRHRDQ